MIRVMTAEEPASTTITVDGKLSGESVEPVETCCIEAISKGKPVQAGKDFGKGIGRGAKDVGEGIKDAVKP